MTPRPWSAHLARPRVPAIVPTLMAALMLSGFGPLAMAVPDRQNSADEQTQRRDQRGQDRRGPDAGRSDNRGDNRGHGRDNSRDNSRDVQRGEARPRDGGWRTEGERRSPPVVVAPAVRRGEPPRWVDNAHGHNHAYPPRGWVVTAPPPRARRVVWAGAPYWYDAGVWYGHGPRGYAVVRPPRGAVVWDLPSFRSVVLIGALAYLYVNGTYYRERDQGGYEVVDAPAGAEPVAALPALAADRVFVYPRQGQSAQQQANDEFDCHRWAKSQTGFDPSATATGQAGGGSPSQRNDYERARGACLDARGYSVG